MIKFGEIFATTRLGRDHPIGPKPPNWTHWFDFGSKPMTRLFTQKSVCHLLAHTYARSKRATSLNFFFSRSLNHLVF